MAVVRLRSDILQAERATLDLWYVTNGATAVGPVALELVERGIEAGKIPTDSYLRHDRWKIWRPLSELCITEALPEEPSLPTAAPDPPPSDGGNFDPRETTMKPALSTREPGLILSVGSVQTPASSHAPMSAQVPASTHAPMSAQVPVSSHAPGALQMPTSARRPAPTQLSASTATPPAGLPLGPRPAAMPQSAAMPPVLLLDDAVEVDPDDVQEETQEPIFAPPPAPSIDEITLPGEDDLITLDPDASSVRTKDALLTLSGVILREVGCDGVMISRVDDEGAITMVAHGPRMFDVIGLRTRLLDPAIVAAASGIVVVGEPTPGPCGQAILSRLEKLGVHGAGAAMLPIRPSGRLYGMVEMGQSSPFSGAAIAKAEALIAVVQAKMEAAGYKPD